MNMVLAVSARKLQRCVALFGMIAIWFGNLSVASAQVLGTGTITGQILNKDTGEYVRNAEVRVVESGVTAISEDGGYYRLTNVPVGDVNLVVAYTGYAPAAATVRVTAGLSATHDFELSSRAPAVTGKDGVIRLDAFVVSSERVGESKALMQQRNAQDITNVVASESFGDIASGNIGDFLQNVAGVEVDIDRGEATTVRLRGLPSQYTAVTLDGVSIASADANGAVAPNTRALNFSAFSLDSLESIEISKTVSADVDANAPAGTINLRPKRAFDRVGRRVIVESHVTAHSGYFETDKSPGPKDDYSRKIWPGGSIQYSDVFFNKRLGINLSVGAHKQFGETTSVFNTYNYTPTATDTRPVVPTVIQFSHTPRTDYRDSVSLTADFKATSDLVLSLGLLYNTSELETWLRDIYFNMGARNTVLGADPLVSLTTSATNAYVVSSPVAVIKKNQTISAIPKFEYRKGDLRIEGKLMISDAFSWYDPWGRAGAPRDLLGSTSPRDIGVTFSATRSSPRDGDWQITQLGGDDWSDGANYTTGVPIVTSNRLAKTFSYSGDVAASLRTRIGAIPIVWKAGVKRYYQDRKYRNDTSLGVHTLNGVPARGGWADYTSPVDYEFRGTGLGASATSLSGGGVWVPDLQKIGGLMRDQPALFTNTISASNYYTAMVSERRNLEETIDAAFLMGTATIGKAILRAGLRWEDTTTDVMEYDPLTRSEMAAAGYATNAATSRATTVAGLQYQYFTKPKIHRVGSYDDLFPSASLKYKLPKGMDLQLGFSSTIRRPTFGDLTGAWSINETLRRVTAPNKNLTPERSRNFALRLSKYFEPRGLIAVNFFQNTISGLFRTNELTAEEFGPVEGDFDYTGYTFITTTQSSDKTVMRGMEIEYNQGLSFLPSPFNGLSVRGSYTRTYADTPITLIVPHAVTGGLNYSYRKFSTYANWTWKDSYLQALGATITRVYRPAGRLDIGGSYKFTQRWSAYFYARNVLDTPRVVVERSGNNPWITWAYFSYGTSWTFGARYIF